MRKRRVSAGLAAAAAVAAVALTACGSAPGGSATGEDVVIGVPMSMTGSQSKEGALARQGYDMWQRWINGRGGIAVGGTKHRVQLRYEDDQSKPDISAQLTEKLVSGEGAVPARTLRLRHDGQRRRDRREGRHPDGGGQRGGRGHLRAGLPVRLR